MATTTFDPEYVRVLIQNTEDATTDEARCDRFVEIMQYVLRFPQLMETNPDFVHTARVKCKTVETAVGDMIASERISFEKGVELVQISEQFLELTKVLAAFDCDDEDYGNIPDID